LVWSLRVKFPPQSVHRTMSTSSPHQPVTQATSGVVGVSAIAQYLDPSRRRSRPFDAELFAKELRSFVPPNAFDAHAHWFDRRHLSPGTPDEAFGGTAKVGYDVMIEMMSAWMGDRTIHDGLYFPHPHKSLDVAAANDFLVSELARRPDSRGLMMITPDCDPAQVEAYVRSHGIAGFKVYHVFAHRPDTLNADQSEFLPEWAWEIANKHGLWITMHMVLRSALADERNQRYIREHCKKYPGANMVLAHAARGFCSRHTVEGIASLRGLDNVYFDTSCVCESAAFDAIIREFGSTRLLYGSDFIVSEFQGRAVNAGDGFMWLFDDNVKWEGWPMGGHTLAGIESLLALKQTAISMHLNDTDIQRIFCTNARDVLRIRPRSDGSASQTLYNKAKALIPGGTQLLSKRPEMHAPQQWPSYYDQAVGCEIIDTEGRRFIDMSMNSVGACLLGYADPDVNAAVCRRVTMGSASLLNSADEVRLAELLIELHPWAKQARFARGGGEAMAVAVRIARAATGRDDVAICGYHGWNDWYLAANVSGPDGSGGTNALGSHLLPGLDPAGVPSGLAGTTVGFAYNKIDQLREIIRTHGSKLAAVVMEPTRSQEPEPGFLEAVRELCDANSTVLIFDEVSVGWRLCLGGAHLRYTVTPDIAVFAKALGNGFPISAIVGVEGVMQAAQKSFISSSYWSEGVGYAAAVATVSKYRRIDVPAHVKHIGDRMAKAWVDLGKRHGLPAVSTGHSVWASRSFDHPQAAAMMTLLTVRMLKQGILAGGGFYPMYAHQDAHVDRYIACADEIFGEIALALKNNDVKERIGGPVKHTGFARLA
jgi:glutamate-1-semialdehyde 2,1-aminomutase